MSFNGGFLVDNIAALATPTDTNADALFPAANLIDKIPSVAYRTTGGNALPRWNFGSAQTVTAFSMHNHNIPNNAVIKLQFSSNNWASIAEELTLTWASQHLFLVFTAKTYQYAGLSVASSNAYVEIGEIGWWTAWQFDRNFNWGARNIRRSHREVTWNRGQAFVKVLATNRGFALSFNDITAAERAKFDDLLEQEKVCFIPSFDTNAPYFGTIEDDEIDGKEGYGGAEFSLRFWADYLGGA
jgi:hypothetical protein